MRRREGEEKEREEKAEEAVAADETTKKEEEQEKEKEEEGEWVWTRIGFGRLLSSPSPSPSPSACVLLPWGARLYAPPSSLVREAEVLRVRTFFEDKGALELRGWAWSRTLGEVRAAFAAHAGVDAGELRFVAEGRERADDALPLARLGLDGTRPELLAVVDPRVAFTFDRRARHPSIEVAPDGLRAAMPAGAMRTDSSIRGSEALSSGCHYWDVAVHAAEPADDGGGARVNVGVCVASGRFNCSNNYIGGSEYGWSLYCNTGETEHGGGSSEYAEAVHGGSTVRVWLDMDARTLAFSIDGNRHAVAFCDLPERVYPAFTLNAPGDAIELVRFGTWKGAGAGAQA